ncbi:MAG: hypothetical protein J3Q66DRAFT_208502 [Benniella sp.]|nr:MAG: hypothetical protein J3Q66DRAFT_208502 [Benniella sp.]
MDPSLVQRFRARYSSEIISIPTRHDPKTRQRVVRWKDILQCFENAKYVMDDGGNTVLFLTDDDLEDLLPLRIPHHPGVVLEVVMPDTGQGDSLSMTSRSIENGSGQMRIEASSSTSGSMERGVIATRMTGGVNSQALVRLSRDPSETALQGIHTSSTGHSQLRSESNMPQQEQLHQLQQQIQQLQQQMERLQHNPQLHQHMEQTQDIQKQLQDQMDEIQRNFEKMDQEMQHSQRQVQDTRQQVQQMDQTLHPIQQKHDQLLQEIHEVKQTIQEQDHLTPDQRRQETMQALDHFALAQYHIQDILHRFYQRSSGPRLFILLPESTGGVDGQERPCPSQFRIYFLCECGTHTMAMNSSEPHEVHLAKYNGYKLDKQDKFIRKYGQYILLMMYMVKYGARTEALIVPPLLGLHHATVPDDGQEHFAFLKENIGRLVDDTIAHLEETFRALGGGTNPAAHQRLGTEQLAQVKRYLQLQGGDDEEEEYGEYGDYICLGEYWIYVEIRQGTNDAGEYVDDDGDPVSKDKMVLVSIGGLSQTMTQAGCVWICCTHKKEHRDSTRLHLIETITANGIEYSEGPDKVEIKNIPSALAKRFYDAVAKVCQVQRDSSQHSLPVFDLKLHSQDSIMEARSSTHLIDLDCFSESLELDFERISMQASVTRRGFKDMVATIEWLGDITQEDTDFILQCQPTQLEIATTPQKGDEKLLIRFLKECPWIDELRIRYQPERLLAILDLVVTANCKRRNHPGGLRVVKLMDESNQDPLGAVTITFSEGSSSFVMDVVLDGFWQRDAEVCDLLQRYGSSIKNLTLPELCRDRHILLLDQATQAPRGSSIAFLNCHSATLTPSGMDALERVISRSTCTVSVQLEVYGLRVNSRRKSALLFLHRFKSRLTSLHLSGENERKWLPNLMRAVSARDDFPVLEELYIRNEEVPDKAGLEDIDQAFSSLALGWISTMVSVPPQPQPRLKSFGMFGISLLHQDMSALIEVIDLSALEELHLHTSITEDQLKVLVDRITDDSTPSLPIRVLGIWCRLSIDDDTKRALRTKLREKIPQIDICGVLCHEYDGW